MYTVKCDGNPLLDTRDEELILVKPRVKVEVNTVGEGSFIIYKNHPYYGGLQKMKSVFEVADENGVLFRGRMTDDTRDFDNGKSVDLEGLMAYFNDSIVRPFAFPDDFLNDADYKAAAASEDKTAVIAFFLGWLIDQHNAQVEEFQRLRLGTVTVEDPNNTITRSESSYKKTWEILRTKLFESALGGKLCIRYEYEYDEDGNAVPVNYIDYLAKFTVTNSQDIVFGENLLDLTHESDASGIYTAIIPFGAEIEEKAADDSEKTVRRTITIEDLPNGDITDDIVKEGDTLYSKSGVALYGKIYAPVDESTWKDVTVAKNLLTKGANLLTEKGIRLTDTVEITAADLHFTDEEIRSFRIYRNIRVFSNPHEISDTYELTKLDIPLLTPQDTQITVGSTKLTLTDMNGKDQSSAIERIEAAEKDIAQNRTEVTEAKQQISTFNTSIMNDCKNIIFTALEDYVATSDYEQFRKTCESAFTQTANDITMLFKSVTDKNGEVMEASKYFTFNDNGIIIGDSNSGITLTVDTDGITFRKAGETEPFGRWDGTDFYTGNIVVEVEKKAQFGNFAFLPRSDKSLMFLKVGG
jgi:hypothetical protein